MPENALPLSFFESHTTLELARKLLGCELVHDSPDGISSGIIVETEAYLLDDPACHAFNKRTPRTEPMYGRPGTIYIYLIYGMYQCVNVVSNREGTGEAVLIRALQPVSGIDIMQMRRNFYRKPSRTAQKNIRDRDLCNGPGKLVLAMGIEKSLHNNGHFSESELYIKGSGLEDSEIATSKRIGISVGVDLPYRFFVKNNLFVSK